jgi:hypothetical protein
MIPSNSVVAWIQDTRTLLCWTSEELALPPGDQAAVKICLRFYILWALWYNISRHLIDSAANPVACFSATSYFCTSHKGSVDLYVTIHKLTKCPPPLARGLSVTLPVYLSKGPICFMCASWEEKITYFIYIQSKCWLKAGVVGLLLCDYILLSDFGLVGWYLWLCFYYFILFLSSLIRNSLVNSLKMRYKYVR